jgi:hypothetical protein
VDILTVRAVSEREVEMFAMLEAVTEHRFERRTIIVNRAFTGVSHRRPDLRELTWKG